MPTKLDGDLWTIGDRAGPAIREELRQVVGLGIGQVVREAKADWPVESGRSRSGLRGEVRLVGPAVQGAVVGAADYTTEVRPRQLAGRTAWQVYVIERLRRLVERMASGQIVVNALRRGLRG